MVWGAIAAAGIGLVGGIIQGNQQRQQADAANETSKKQAEARYERDLKEWSINYLEAQSNYAWSLANTEAQRYIDRVRQADYEANQSRIIDAALLNLELNTEALKDQYVTSERLRALEAQLGFDKSTADLLQRRDNNLDALDANADEARLRRRLEARAARRRFNDGEDRLLTQYATGAAIEEARFIVGEDAALRKQTLRDTSLGLEEALEKAQINTNSAVKQAGIDNRSSQAAVQNMQAVAGYMNSIKQRSQQANQLARAKENEGKGIQEQIVIGETLDTIQRDAQYITAIVKDADTRASSVARGGGSNSSRRVAMDAMQAFGRSYGELMAIQSDRRRAMNNYNGQLVGETSSQMAQIATAISGEADRVKYTKQGAGIQKQGFDIETRANELEKTLSTIAVEKTTALGKTINDMEYDGALNDLQLGRRANLAQLQDTRDLGLQDLLTTKQLTIGQGKRLNRLNKQQIGVQRKNTRQEWRLNNRSLLNNFNKLTVPGFELARRQGERDYAALTNNTYNEIKAAATPYREAIIFDPLEPIAGLKPEKGTFTPVAKPSYGSILAQSFISGAQGALSMSYTDANGNLAFR